MVKRATAAEKGNKQKANKWRKQWIRRSMWKKESFKKKWGKRLNDKGDMNANP